MDLVTNVATEVLEGVSVRKKMGGKGETTNNEGFVGGGPKELETYVHEILAIICTQHEYA